jgi:uncharacterized membrane protein YphA (DoxX/SURF4 family)
LKSQLFALFGIATILMAVVSLCLSLGLLTRSVAALCGADVLAELMFAPHAGTEGAIVVSAVSFCVFALGPGAYSIDSLMYGRRKRIFPPE